MSRIVYCSAERGLNFGRERALDLGNKTEFASEQICGQQSNRTQVGLCLVHTACGVLQSWKALRPYRQRNGGVLSPSLCG